MNIADSAIPRLIELARWAPSGDNTQPWRFERLAADHLVIHGFDTRDHCVYDLDGHPSQIAIGAMIETMRIAATEQSLALDVTRRLDAPDTRPTFDVRLRHSEGLAPDRLLSAIPRRSVNRRPYSTRPLTADEMQQLQDALPAGYTLRWFSSLGDRWRMARLMFANAKLRLTMREAFEVHRAIIDWGQRYSADKVPDQALGVDAMTLKLMRWAMADWKRVSFMNRWLGGTLAPRLQMDFVPSMLCAAHVAIVASTAPVTLDDYVNVGHAVQRLWLSATRSKLQSQPEMTPLIFYRYAQQGRQFSEQNFDADISAKRINLLHRALGQDAKNAVWLARIGRAINPKSRSERLSPFALTK
ncbi:molybdopterin biosynthesis protein MoeY [Aquabacterium sp. OR-4]|uniref:molybdopterin biosynthesis protein MoeY n=1 Tax=Aquabacterium sp. OR-4 TaxID=2978127 RepID=UPI0021B42532|nr:molybdopterin biosynthesis protein MoeY [Aquabacterium sp. OR-4]MDT7837679.1 molybdopterin biosynthesis protein MoeY [Aquabacterium sp. OR-4]